ncbi:hypothetical protein Ga0061062_103268 [Comamonas thiooxydans]|nr:hypothetical protein Ga0061062_103268 [Comamonas thiooxydans]
MQPHSVVPCPIRYEGIVRKHFRCVLHYYSQVNTYCLGHPRWRQAEGFMSGTRTLSPACPCNLSRCSNVSQGRNCCQDIGIYSHRGAINTAYLCGVDVHVNKILLWDGNFEKRIATCSHVSQASSQSKYYVCVDNCIFERRIHPKAHVANILRITVVQHILATE